jgi:hypothetical protein
MLKDVMEREHDLGYANGLKHLSASPNARGTCDANPRPWSREGDKGIDGITWIPLELSKTKPIFG